MLELLIIWCALLSLCFSLHQRDGVTVATYEEALDIMRNNPDFRYLNEPMIITDSVMSEWTLYDNLEKIFGSDYEINVNQQSTDCDCFADSPIQYALCEQFASSFLYYRPNNNYKYWLQFEAKHKESSKYMHCLNKVRNQRMSVSQAIQRVAAKDRNTHFYVNDNHSINASNQYEPSPKNCVLSKTPSIRHGATNTKEYNKLYSYFNVFGMHNEPQMVSALQLNTLDQIRLSPYFDVFGMRGYLDVQDVHLWFGTEYYRAMRHYDKANNLFFVLQGSRTFRVSPPTLNVFPLHPFGHSSGRQQYPYYPVLENENSQEGIQIPDEYHVSEVTIFENEVFYLPAFWYHEVINNNFTVAMSVWWSSVAKNLQLRIVEMMLPINPTRADGMDRYQINAFLYFTQRLIERFCDILHENEEHNVNHVARCMDPEYKGYGFLTSSFEKIYRILDEITYDRFEWMALVVDVENIIKCSRNRISDYEYENVTHFKNDLYVCWDFEYEFKMEWDSVVGDIVDMLLDFTHVGIAELVLQEYLENILLALSEDSNMLPIWFKIMNL